MLAVAGLEKVPNTLFGKKTNSLVLSGEGGRSREAKTQGDSGHRAGFCF
jgi:hypothetical protein